MGECEEVPFDVCDLVPFGVCDFRGDEHMERETFLCSTVFKSEIYLEIVCYIVYTRLSYTCRRLCSFDNSYTRSV